MIDLSRRLLDDGAAPTRSADAEQRRKADAARAVNRLFTGPAYNAPRTQNGTGHALSGDPRIALKGEAIDPVAAERQAKLDSMLPAVRAKAGPLTVEQLLALDLIARQAKARDGDPVDVLAGDVARVIRSDHGRAETVLDELVTAGALRKVQGLWGATRYLPTL